jgi:hypothetical protein
MLNVEVDGEEPVVRILERKPLDGSEEIQPGTVLWLPEMARFDEAVFRNGYPVVDIHLVDDAVPVEVSMTAWGPTVPTDTLNSMLPAAVMEWTLTNKGKKPVKFSVALAMKNPLGTGEETVKRSDDSETINTIAINEWNGFTFSNTGSKMSPSFVGTLRVITSFRSEQFLYCSGETLEWKRQLWNDFSADGNWAPRIDSPVCTENEKGVGVMFTPGLLDPGESVTIPFMFSWYISNGQRVSGFANGDSPDKGFFSGNAYTSQFADMDELSDHLIEHYDYLRERTMQFSNAMVTSTISEALLLTVLSGFSSAVEQREPPVWIIDSPFADEITNRSNASAINGWRAYLAASGYIYERDRGRMLFSPALDVLPIRFFWSTDTGWGTINVSRARIVLTCIHGSVGLQQLILQGRSFFVFREFVPSLSAEIRYEDEALIVDFTEEISIYEGGSFTMEIP